MNKLIAILIAIGIFIFPFNIYAEEIDYIPSIDENATMSVHMQHSSLTGGNSTSQIIRPHWNSNIGAPATINSYTSSLNNIGSLNYRNEVSIDISSPNLSSGMVIYIGLYQAHLVTKFQVTDDKVDWSVNDNGYIFNGAWSSTNCSVDPDTFINQLVPANSDWQPTVSITRSGSTYSGIAGHVTLTNISRSTPSTYVPGIPGAGSGLYQGWYYPTTTGSYRLFKVTLDDGIGVDYDTVRLTFSSSTASGFSIKTGSTGYYCTPVVAVPIFMAFPTTPTSQDFIASKMDEIIQILSGDIEIGIDIQPILDAIGDTSQYTIMNRLIQISSHLSNIKNYLNQNGTHTDINDNAQQLLVSIDGWLHDIGIDMAGIYQELDEQLAFLSDISDWLESIEGILQGTAQQISAISAVQESTDEYIDDMADIEDDAWSDASSAITALNLNTFTFDNGVIIGFANTRTLFGNLWTSIGVINQIYIVCMALTVGMIAIRYIKPSGKAKKE